MQGGIPDKRIPVERQEQSFSQKQKCAVCKKRIQFNLFSWRHRCRACNNFVCSKCSTTRLADDGSNTSDNTVGSTTLWSDTMLLGMSDSHHGGDTKLKQAASTPNLLDAHSSSGFAKVSYDGVDVRGYRTCDNCVRSLWLMTLPKPSGTRRRRYQQLSFPVHSSTLRRS